MTNYYPYQQDEEPIFLRCRNCSAQFQAKSYSEKFCDEECQKIDANSKIIKSQSVGNWPTAGKFHNPYARSKGVEIANYHYEGRNSD